MSVIPNLVRQLFADAAISAAFVPVFTQLFSRGEKERAYRLASSLLTFMIVVVGVVVALLVVAAPLLVRLVYPEFADHADLDRLATQMLQLLLPTVLVFSVAGVMIGVLYAYERFVMPAVVSIVWNLVIIAFLVFFSAPELAGHLRPRPGHRRRHPGRARAPHRRRAPRRPRLVALRSTGATRCCGAC